MNVASKIQTVLLFYFAQVLFEVGSECACVNVGVGVGVGVHVRVCVVCVRENFHKMCPSLYSQILRNIPLVNSMLYTNNCVMLLPGTTKLTTKLTSALRHNILT
jgi:hypothetical protein